MVISINALAQVSLNSDRLCSSSSIIKCACWGASFAVLARLHHRLHHQTFHTSRAASSIHWLNLQTLSLGCLRGLQFDSQIANALRLNLSLYLSLSLSLLHKPLINMHESMTCAWRMCPLEWRRWLRIIRQRWPNHISLWCCALLARKREFNVPNDEELRRLMSKLTRTKAHLRREQR